MSTFIYPSYLTEVEQQQYQAFVRDLAPKAWVRSGDVIESEYWNRLRTFLATAKVPVTTENLVIAHGWLVEEQRLAQARFERQLQATTAVVDANPTLIRGDHTNDIVTAWWAQHPDGTGPQLQAYLKTKSDDSNLWSDAKPIDMVALVRVADKNRLAELVRDYGEERIHKALNDLQRSLHRATENARAKQSWRVDPGSKQVADAEAAQRRHDADPKVQERARKDSEFLETSAQVGTHAENARLRSAIKATFIRVDGIVDWVKTLKARQDLYKNWR